MVAIEETVEPEPLKRRAVFVSWRLFVIVSFVIIVLVVGFLIVNRSRPSDLERGNRALVEAFANRRLIEPRLSGGFKGSEFNPSRDDLTGLDMRKFERARDLIHDAVANGDPKAQLAYGRLLLSEGEKLPVASRYLRRALQTAPADANAHNDLGVCLIQQGKLEDAIDEFNAALTCRSNMNEALFNRALCYEKLHLRDTAIAGFAELANIEEDKGWLKEIRQRGERLAQPVSPQPYAETLAALDAAFKEGRIDYLKLAAGQRSELIWHHALIDLVREYLQAVSDNDLSKADLALQELTAIGDVLADLYGDSEVGDATRYLKSLPAKELGPELRLVAEFVDTTRARGDHHSTYERLRDEFGKRGNEVFQAICWWYLAVDLYSGYQYLESVSTLRSMLPLVMKHEWLNERRILMGQLGLAYSRLGHDSLALTYFNECLAWSRKLHAAEAKALQNLSLPYWHVGDFDKALNYLHDSISLSLAEGRELNELAYNYLQVGDIYRLRDRHDLAILYAKESLKFADQAKHYRFGAQASSLMAVEQARLNDFQGAEENLQRAFANLRSMGEATANAYNRPLVLTRAADVSARSGDIPRALQYCNEAEKLVSAAQEKRLPLVRVHLARADALLGGKRPREARSSLEGAIDILEGYRANIASNEDRSYFLETSQTVFDRLITLNLQEAGREAEAFELSERARARALLDDISSDADGHGKAERPSIGLTRVEGRKPANLRAVQLLMPADLTLVEYSVTDRGTFIFLVSRTEFRVARSSANSALIDKLVNDYLSNLKNPATREDSQSRTELSRRARDLYNELIQPIGRLPKIGTRLCIVPDKSLHFLPFAALENSEGTYLIKDYVLTYAPSASVLLRCSEQSVRRHRSGAEKILAVGNPRFDRKYFSELGDLPNAETEAVESAGFYAQREILTATAATRPSVLANLPDCDVAHFALHCLINNSSPWRAALVLSSTDPNKLESASNPADRSARVEQSLNETHEDELLPLADLSQVSLPRTKLVVLSACQTGLGRYFKGEGMVSLVRPFIASGVPTVVASLWSVDSQATYELMVRFHMERTTSHGGAGESLRAAQLNIMDGTFQHPYYWAGFIAVGR
jgi:CHAT domain-containing protein/Flp pilus assembly protein TadD